MPLHKNTILSFLLTIFLLVPVTAWSRPVPPLQVSLIDLLESKQFRHEAREYSLPEQFPSTREILELYAEHKMFPLWVDSTGPNQKAAALLNALKSSYRDGLDPENYNIRIIEQYWNSTDPKKLARLDIILSQSLGHFLSDITSGKIDPCMLDPKLFGTARESRTNSITLIEQAYSSLDLQHFINKSLPSHNAYKSLKEALSSYRDIALKGGWEEVPPGKSIRPGDKNNRIPAIRKRLSITQDFQGEDLSSLLYDEKFMLAVLKFQHRHNLKIDGIIGKNTLAAMNVPVEQRVGQILINMERWRWLPSHFARKSIFVNIAGFYLNGILDNKVEISLPVIVGKVYHKTPVFSDVIRYIEFNPYWNVPNSIAKKEFLPELIKNPYFLKEKNIRVLDGWDTNAPEVDSTSLNWQEIGKKIVRYRLRQDPGPGNALGTVKFMFPNRFNVYLHDTPSRNLFRKEQRAFSHGCIRVSQPSDFALYLLKDNDENWTMERINEIVASGRRTIIPLQKPVPIHILYRTVIVNPDTGAVAFFKDVYGRDEILLQALFPDGLEKFCRYPPSSN